MNRIPTYKLVIVVWLVLSAFGAAFWIMELIHNRAYFTLAFALVVGAVFNLGWYAHAYCSREQYRDTDRFKS